MNADEERDFMINWFGTSWGAWVCKECPETPTPVRTKCMFCGNPILASERGITMVGIGLEPGLIIPNSDPPRSAAHIDCFLRSIMPDFDDIIRV